MLLDRHWPGAAEPGTPGQPWTPTVGSIDAPTFGEYAAKALERLGSASAISAETVLAVHDELAPRAAQVSPVVRAGRGWAMAAVAP